jgi:hypothetical protein
MTKLQLWKMCLVTAAEERRPLHQASVEMFEPGSNQWLHLPDMLVRCRVGLVQIIHILISRNGKFALVFGIFDFRVFYFIFFVKKEFEGFSSYICQHCALYV